MKFEDLYVDGKKIRTLERYFGYKKFCQNRLQKLGDVFPDAVKPSIYVHGENKTKGEHGYTERTHTVYYHNPDIGPVELIADTPIGQRNPDVGLVGVKYGLETLAIEYKYLLKPEVMESMPIPDSAILSYYGVTIDSNNQLKDQVDVYFTVPGFEDIATYAAIIGLPTPIKQKKQFHPDDMLGVSFVESTMEPIRLKYYQMERRYTLIIKSGDDWGNRDSVTGEEVAPITDY
jgi:hypothetical protein